MGERRHLPTTRDAVTHRFEVGGHRAYLTVGLFGDGMPGEIFVRIAKTGATLSGLLDGWAITTSLALQYGVPLQAIVSKLSYTRFDPCGFTGTPGIEYATSLLDYISRWLAQRFLSAEGMPILSLPPPEDAGTPPCKRCGTLMQRADPCFVCPNCAEVEPKVVLP